VTTPNVRHIGINEARPILGDLATAVEQGATVILTRRGRPVARLTRYQETTMHSTESASTPIAQGGYTYVHEIDGPDFADHTADELRDLEAERDLDFSAHPALAAEAVRAEG
jgi:prevent-host-death family protein